MSFVPKQLTIPAMPPVKKLDHSDLISRSHLIYSIEKDGLPVPAWLRDMIESEPSARQERLTDDDFETIRIHLNAHKEKLCNQRRWEEAEEYQRIIDRFMAFASAEPEIIHCKDCKYYYNVLYNGTQFECGKCCRTFTEDVKPDDYCSRGEQE